jgi:hypothetical protein
VLTRKNTVNGLLYKDDPAILGWNIFNEMRCHTDQVPPGKSKSIYRAQLSGGHSRNQEPRNGKELGSVMEASALSV